jgi:hypothetical protein
MRVGQGRKLLDVDSDQTCANYGQKKNVYRSVAIFKYTLMIMLLMIEGPLIIVISGSVVLVRTLGRLIPEAS